MKQTRLIKLTSSALALATLSTFGFTSFGTALSIKSSDLSVVVAKGDAQITDRLQALTKASAKLNDMKKLSTANKAALQTEISSAQTDLTQLKAKLDADTTLAQAKTDAASIFTSYRVYALVIPKVHILKVADDQLDKEAKLMAFGSTLQAKVAASKQQTTLASKVADMQAKVKAARALTQTVDTTVLALKASDYNANHAVLTTQLTNLKTAQADNQAAYQEGLSVMQALK